ncbi:MAG: outer membrane protein [Flavobacterium sp.]|jgi:outer membrane protein
MKQLPKILVSFLFIFGLSIGHSQEILTLKEAIEIGLEKNFDIQISKNNKEIAVTNVAIGNAGILPSLTGNINDNNSVTQSTQTRSDGVTNELNNARNNTLNYGVNLNWTIFDGFRMFARYDQLKTLNLQSEVALQMVVLTKVSDIAETYYTIVQQQEQLKALDTTIVISKKRYDLANNRFTIGRASKLEVLNAEVDWNTDKSNFTKQKELVANSKTLLNQIIGRDLTTPYSTSLEFDFDKSLILADILNLSEKQNPQLKAQILSKEIAELELKQIKANRYPTINILSGYTISQTESSLGFLSQSSNKGFNYGFTATLNLFDGFAQKRNEKIAKIQIENSKIAIDQQEQNLKSAIITAYQSYLTNSELTEIEAKNESIAKQNLDITLAKYKIGTLTTLEFRTAQLNYVNAKVRSSNSKYLAKLSEITLQELAGNLSLN